jgi:16S rRNA (guanine527-N7)-methyltransferase
MEPDRAAQLLSQGLSELYPRLEIERRDILLELARLLERWTQHLHLTAHRSLEQIVVRLVLDAAALWAQLPEIPSVVDLGSGAGFPGFPFAVLRPGARVTLIESRERRHHFQRAVVRELGLENVTPVLGRAEVLEATPHAAVIAQAIARPAQAVMWMRDWAEAGGLVLLPGAESAPQVPRTEGISFEAVQRYDVPCGGPKRTLWIGRRSS